jgi:CheY-like chemotaxis protein
MLDQEDLKWIAATSTDLNSIVQQVSRYADLIRRHKGEHNYVDLLSERVELASKTSQALFDRVTTKILEGAAVRKGGPVKFTVVQSPAPGSGPQTTTPQQQSSNADNGRRPVAPTLFPPEVRIVNPKGNREYLLLVEDEPDVAEIAAELLAEEGYRVIVAHDGFEALKIYEQAIPQIALVILDFFLPVMDGDAVFDELRTINSNVSVVLSSGFAEQSKIASMLAKGLRGFMPKPYTRDKLLEQVRSVLDMARQTGS